MRLLIVAALLMTASAATAATGSCAGGSGQLTQFYPCTIAQESAQDRWFEKSWKCWRRPDASLVGERGKCLAGIRPKLKDFSK